MDIKPIKRNKNIVILSREHHSGLLFCWKIRQGIKKNAEAERIQQYVSYFWKDHLYKHFNEEETLMFLKVDDDACRKALEQHDQIRLLFKLVTNRATPISYSLLTQLADMVDDHIRFEERELFPHLEKVLDEEQLKHIGAALEQSHAVVHPDQYPDAFWTGKKLE